MSKEKIFVDYGKYLRCNIPRFWEILREERTRGVIKTWHHVFTGKLKNGAWKKKGLSKNRLEEEFGNYELDMNEGVYLAAAIHSVLNKLLRNCSPPVIFANLNCIFDSNLIDCETKKLFTKLVLYIVEEKLERMIASRECCSLAEISEFDEQIKQRAAIIHVDTNNGNKMKIEAVMAFLGISRDEIVSFLSKNFLPKDWTKYPEELWDLYL